MSTASVEVVYRGVFQKNLAKNICRGIVFAARKEGKIGIAFGRYSDSPERNGIPAKQFAVVADADEEMEEYLSRYEPDSNDVTVVTDDTLCKGLESWAWAGLQPVNKLTKDGGTLLVTSTRSAESLLSDIHRKGKPYKLATVKGSASFSGMWIYKDDHTDVRVLGSLARVASHVVGLEAIVAAINDPKKNAAKEASARKAFDAVMTTDVSAEEGNTAVPSTFQLPGWKKMEECLVIRGIGAKREVPASGGGFVPARNRLYRKFSTRTMRPVINFDACTKCTICWLQCPDGSFDITPDGHYDVNLEACCGCGICESVCPVEKCITMINEEAFTDNRSQWEVWAKDRQAYSVWLSSITSGLPARSHGFHHPGQYAEEVSNEPA